MKTEVVEQEKVKKKEVAAGAGALILVLLVVFAFAKKKKEKPIAGWVSPTSFYDEYTRWLNEENAYDKNIGTYCYTPSGMMVYGYDPLELRLSNPVSGCDKVGIYCCGYQPGRSLAPNISIELYYDNDWHEIFKGELEPQMEWVEVTNPAGAKTVSKARIKRYSTRRAYIYEFEFWGSLK